MVSTMMQLVITLICCIKTSVIAVYEPCFTTNQISEWRRSVAYADTFQFCDTFLLEGWYRVTSGAGEMMPTECPKFGFRCGTVAPFYLSREGIIDPTEQTFPTSGKTVDRVACSADMNGHCCKERIDIKIKNCGKYFVYYLNSTDGCPSAFCFGDKLPCPEGESSETGFYPGCGTFPNVTVPTPIVTTGLYEETRYIQEHKAYNTFQTVKFQCETKIETNYTYDVRWYINDFEITEATHIDVPGNNLSFDTMLRQNHWEQIFKPNMMVQCSVQVREKSFTAPGRRSYSAYVFAGIKVNQNVFHIKEGANNSVAVPIELTIPIGCSYPTTTNNTGIIIENTCLLKLLTGVPYYEDKDGNCESGLSDDELVFGPQNCGVVFSYTDWKTPQPVYVTAVSDGILNSIERLAILQLYNHEKGSFGLQVLDIWNGIMLPAIKFIVIDRDEVTLGSTCQSNNDPHLVTFDGKSYELQKTAGEYVMYQHKKLPIRIHSVYQRCNRQRALCNCGAAVRSGNSLFVANFCSGNRSVKQFICNDHDIIVEEKTNGYYLTVPSGTRLDISMGNVYHFYGINHFHLKGSSLDYNMTLGLCGTYNKKRSDDFKLPNGLQNTNANIFAESWRIKTNSSSLFNFEKLPPINFGSGNYCTCKTKDIDNQFTAPEYVCDLTDAKIPCQKLTQAVYPGPCKTHERHKRSFEYKDDEEPEDIEIPLNDPQSGDPDISWKNGWTIEKASQHCNNAFLATTSFTVCKDNVPSIPPENLIDNCVVDIQITGDTQWVDVSTDNYASACLGEAMKLENLTQANTVVDGVTETIFDVIASSTCPRNCSGNGMCTNGQCNCTNGYFGSDCSLEKSQAPVLAPNSFNGVCDSSLRSCQSYIVPGIHFLKGNLICRFRPFKIILNETVEIDILEETPGKYFGPFYMHCPAPGSRRKRSTTDESSALGYHLSVSNDGRNFTEELIILIYNKQCLYCNVTIMECTELDTCPVVLVPVVVINSDNNTPLIAGLCGGFATLTIILLIVLVTKKYSKRSNQTQPATTNTGPIKTAY